MLICFRVFFDINDIISTMGEYGSHALWIFQIKLFSAISITIFAIILLQVYLHLTITAPLNKLTKQMRQMVQKGEFLTLPVEHQDQIGELTTSFNTMSEHIKRRIKEQEQFAENVCHEIQTPLTTAISASEILLANKSLSNEKENIFKKLIQTETMKLKQLTETIISYAKKKVEIGNLTKVETEVNS